MTASRSRGNSSPRPALWPECPSGRVAPVASSRRIAGCLANPALDLIELCGERVQFLLGRGGFGIGVLRVQQARLLFRLSGNEPLQFAFAIEQGGIDAASDLSS